MLNEPVYDNNMNNCRVKPEMMRKDSHTEMMKQGTCGGEYDLNNIRGEILLAHRKYQGL